jgi:iron complex transport system permease protein
MQGVFRNPLADPGIIGVSGGGAIGAITMIVLGSRFLPENILATYSLYLTPLAAMAGAVAMTVVIYNLSLRRGQVDLISMLLVGIAINAIGGAFIGLVSAFLATAEELQSVTFWTMGSLSRATWDLIFVAGIFAVVPMLILPRYASALNALALGEEDAAHLGVDVRRVKRGLIVLSASLVGATVALCGMIGFIPLVAPHIVRTAVGSDHRFLMPASALVGAALLLVADMAARSVVAPAELPLGILTGLLGAPVFLSLIIKRNRAHL